MYVAWWGGGDKGRGSNSVMDCLTDNLQDVIFRKFDKGTLS